MATAPHGDHAGGRTADDPDASTRRGTRWSMVVLAVLAGIGAAALAPRSWPAGDATLELEYRGAVAGAATQVGSAEPFEFTEDLAGAEVLVVLPAGAPSGDPVEATIQLTSDGVPTRPDLHDVSLRLILADGRVEPIPVIAWDEEAKALTASRRPPVGAGAVLGLLAVVVVLWVSEAIPLAATSLLVPVVLVVARVAEADAALAPFFDPVIALFFGVFLMVEGMRRAGLDRFIAVGIVARAGRSPAVLFATMVGLSAFLSMWLSNTATAALLIPVAIAITAPLDNRGYRRAVVLGIAYGATIGGVGSVVGTPANPLAIRFLGEFAGRDVSFVGWFGFGLPVLLFFLPVMGVYLWVRTGAHVDRDAFAATRREAQDERRALGSLDRAQWTVLAVFLGVVAIWMTQPWHDLDTGIVAIGGAVGLALVGRVTASDLSRISWNVLIIFGGGLALGEFLVRSGAADWIATRLGGLGAVPAPIAVTVIAIVTLALTAVASNTASAAMLIPLAIPLAAVIGVDPVMLVVVVAIASSIDFALVIGTPPTMLAYATELYTVREIFRIGVPLDAIGVAILVTLGVGGWRLLGLI